MRATPRAGTPAKEKENVVGTPTREKENMAGTPAREKEKGRDSGKRKRKCGWDSSKRKRNMWPGLRQLNDDVVGTPTRKGLGLQQIYGVANLISKYERCENLVLHGYLHG